MGNYYKYIVTYLTIFSLLLSSFGITIYYHHCNKEKVIYKSLVGKLSCDSNSHTDTQEPSNSCCHDNGSDAKHCSNQKKQQASSDLIIDTISCCYDNQFTNKLSDDFVANSKQSNKENQIEKISKKEQIPSNKYPILQKFKENINKKIIQPIKKFISLIQQIAKLANQSDSENDEDSGLY